MTTAPVGRWPRVEGGWSPEAFERAYLNHNGAVHAMAAGVHGSQFAADITQEVFLRLWRDPEHATAPTTLRTRLLTMTYDVLVGDPRAETVPPEENACGARSRRPPNGPRPVPSPIDMLPSEEREAIVTAYFGGCTYREAATVLGLRETTVKSRIRRGLKRIHVALAESGSASPGTGSLERSVSDQGLGDALDSREVVAQAQGILMELEGSSAGEALDVLLRWSNKLGVTLSVCAQMVVASAENGARGVSRPRMAESPRSDHVS